MANRAKSQTPNDQQTTHSGSGEDWKDGYQPVRTYEFDVRNELRSKTASMAGEPDLNWDSRNGFIMSGQANMVAQALIELDVCCDDLALGDVDRAIDILTKALELEGDRGTQTLVEILDEAAGGVVEYLYEVETGVAEELEPGELKEMLTDTIVRRARERIRTKGKKRKASKSNSRAK
jgi:hypothetical protein